MPSYLRRFYTRELVDVKEEEKKEIDKMKQKSPISKKPGVIPKFKR